MTFRDYELLMLVRDHGRDYSLTRKVGTGVYNPATGGIDGGSEVVDPFKGYMSQVVLTMGQPLDVSFGSRTCIIPAANLDNKPKSGDLISGTFLDSVKVTSVREISSKEKVLVYLVGVEE